MRRALILALTLLFLLPVAAQAQLNYRDQKAVDAEINRRVEEQLKQYAPQFERNKKAAEDASRQIEQLQKQSPAPAVNDPNRFATGEFECKKGGCGGEICQPTLPGFDGMVGTCEHLTFYDCYKTASCIKTKDPSGKTNMCRWQDTPELRNCLLQKGGKVGLAHALLNP